MITCRFCPKTVKNRGLAAHYRGHYYRTFGVYPQFYRSSEHMELALAATAELK